MIKLNKILLFFAVAKCFSFNVEAMENPLGEEGGNGVIPLLTQQVGNMGLNTSPMLMDEDSEDEENYQYRPPRSERKLPLPASFEKELKEFNAQLVPNRYPNFSEYTPFYIPFYRGVHYLQELFPTANDRKTHRLNAKAGSPLFCSAAYELCGKNFLDQDIDVTLLEKNSRLIAKVLGRFKTNHPKEYYKFHEIYSNDHNIFHGRLARALDLQEVDPSDSLYPFHIYKNLFGEIIGLETEPQRSAFPRNPFVSCSMAIAHALKYSFGLKSFDGTPLNPCYTKKSRPKHPYLGMLYVILIDPANLLNISPTSTIGAEQQGDLEIRTQGASILTEYEVSFFGWIPPQYVFLTMPVRVPNFKRGIQEYHNKKYGWTSNKSLKNLLALKKIFKNRSDSLSLIIERKIQDELTQKYPSTPIYQAHWRPDGKFGPSLISTSTILALRKPNIYFTSEQGQQKITSYDLEYLAETLSSFRHMKVTLQEADSTYGKSLFPELTLDFVSYLSRSLQERAITSLTLTKLRSHDSLKKEHKSWSTLLHNNSLTYLDLSNNHMGDDAITYIGQELSHNSQLKTLKIAKNAGTYKAAINLSKALVMNHVLTELNFSENIFTSDDNLQNLCTNLSQNSTLKKLVLAENNIIQDYCLYLTQLTNLSELNLKYNNITNDDIKKILTERLSKTKLEL